MAICSPTGRCWGSPTPTSEQRLYAAPFRRLNTTSVGESSTLRAIKCAAQSSSTRGVVHEIELSGEESQLSMNWDALRQGLAATALSLTLTVGGAAYTNHAYAVTNNNEVGTCVLRNCQKALAGCLGDAQCLENLICLQTCNGKDDETACQIKCGDKYQDAAIDTFNKCAVSEKKCVPQRVDEGLYPVPPDCALDKDFDLSSFQGRWYITAGLNPLFDTFPCQEHYFASTSSNKSALYAEINWRIPISDGKDFLQRSTMQRFVQTPENPAILLNHDNEYLHYQDDWYIIASKPEKYVFIYYRGQNDAWKGYGGATVYTREAHLPEEYIPELQEAADRAGLNWNDFTITDNSCPPKPQLKGPFEELEEDLEKVEEFASKEVSILEHAIEPELVSFGKGFTILEKKVESAAEDVVKEVEEEEEALLRELEREKQEATRLIRSFQKQSTEPFWKRLLSS